MKLFFLSITTSIERNIAISHLRDAIDKSGGWIVDQVFFSNISTNIAVEIPNEKICNLIDMLIEKSLTVEIKSEFPSKTNDEVRCQIVLDFIHEEKDIKGTVPAFG